jgi:CUE domain
MQRPNGGGMFEAQITSLQEAFPSRSREQILQALQER